MSGNFPPMTRNVKITSQMGVNLECTMVQNDQESSTGPVVRLFAYLLPPLSHSLALFCSLRSRTPLRSFICSLAHSITHSLTRTLTPKLIKKWMIQCFIIRLFRSIVAWLEKAGSWKLCASTSIQFIHLVNFVNFVNSVTLSLCHFANRHGTMRTEFTNVFIVRLSFSDFF